MPHYSHDEGGVHRAAKISSSFSGVEKSEAVANILKGYEEFTLDLTGKIISSNLEAVNITGYEEWEAIGRSISMFYADSDISSGQPQRDLEKTLAANRITFSSWRVKKRNVAFWAQITISCLKTEAGHLRGYKMILKDQTHQLLSKKRLKKFRSEYLNVFNNPFIGIFKFRLNGFRIQLINDKAQEIIGIGREEKRFNNIFKLENEFAQFIDVLLREEKVTAFEFEVNRDAHVWARIECRTFKDEGFAEGVITDITDSRQQLNELRRVNEELDTFIYHASHDLRAPLTSLLGLINLMQIDTQIGLKDYCEMLRGRVDVLDELLSEMAVIASNNKSDVVVELINFSDIMRSALTNADDNSNVKVNFYQPTDLPFYCDKSRMLTIFNGLIAWAIKHHNPHSTSPFLNVAVAVRDERAIITFTDNGRGLRDEQLLQAFGIFYKTSSEIKDAGLGLYITKLIVDKLQGEISLRSKIGEGSQFRIELPDLRSKNMKVDAPHKGVTEIRL
jgi:PAS domain S-box-containing protein